MATEPNTSITPGLRRVILLRSAVAGILVIVIGTYILLIFAKPIPRSERLDAAEIGLIAVTAVVIGVILNPTCSRG